MECGGLGGIREKASRAESGQWGQLVKNICSHTEDGLGFCSFYSLWLFSPFKTERRVPSSPKPSPSPRQSRMAPLLSSRTHLTLTALTLLC